MRRTVALALALASVVGCVTVGSNSRQSITTSGEDARFVTLGGIDQWITIRTEDSRRPILIVPLVTHPDQFIAVLTDMLNAR
jgi:hypothetical protein